MGFNTNTTNRLPAITPIGTTFVFDISVLPAPISNVITLLPGNYIIADDVDFGINNLKFDSVGEDLTIQTLDSKFSKITSATTGTFIDVVNARNLNLASLDITLSGAGATFFNILGLTGTTRVDFVNVNFTGSGTKTIGLVGSGAWTNRNMAFSGWTNGITFDNATGISWDNAFLVSDFTGSGAAITIDSITIAGNFNGTGVIGSASQSLFDITPNFSNFAEILITQVLNRGASTNYFAGGFTDTISAFATATVASTTIDSVSTTGTIARFNFTVGPTLFVGQEVTIVGFIINSAYNVTGIITVVGAGFFEISSIAFGTDESGGSFSGLSVTVTSNAHGRASGSDLLIINTIAYNAGYTIYNALTNTFQINAAFMGDETTGSWDSGSLTEKDSRVTVFECGSQKNSLVAGGWSTVANTAVTDVLDGSYVDLDLGTATALSFNERLTLFDPVTGALRYNGADPEVLNIPIEFRLEPQGGGVRTYEFKMEISTDGGSSYNDLPDIIETQVQASGSGTDLLFSTFRSVLMNQADIVKYRVSGVGTANDFIAVQGCTSII